MPKENSGNTFLGKLAIPMCMFGLVIAIYGFNQRILSVEENILTTLETIRTENDQHAQNIMSTMDEHAKHNKENE